MLGFVQQHFESASLRLPQKNEVLLNGQQELLQMGQMVWKQNFFVGQFFFLKVETVLGENIIQDWILGTKLIGVVSWVDCVLQLSKAGSCFQIQARPLL